MIGKKKITAKNRMIITLDTAAANGPLDLLRLQKIYKTREEIQEILELYLESARPQLAAIYDSLLRKDGEAIFFTTHKLKGASVNIGAIGMAELCRQMEEAAKGADWEKANGLHKNLVFGFAGIEWYINGKP
jgi:HPt (histidine-containing phosphotransfer) domain-containing protein